MTEGLKPKDKPKANPVQTKANADPEDNIS